MRNWIVSLAAAAALSGCGGVEYRDTNSAVDARPECASGPLRPGEKPPAWCERSHSATWSTGEKGEKVEFGKDED